MIEQMLSALKGLRVIDLSQVMAGPFCTMVLGDLGAEIIKVEPPSGDYSRKMPPHFHDQDSGYYIAMNKNKKSIVINLKELDGLKIFYDLVAKSDVVVDNFRPGVLKSLKIDYETLKTYNKGIISCSITGFGLDSPYTARPALDLIIQSMSGAMSFTGEPDRPPVRMGIPMGDLGAGLFAAVGILAALNARDRAGVGQKIDISMLDCLIALTTYRAQYYFMAGEVPKPVGSGHVSSVPIRAFKTKDDYLVIDSGGEVFWQKLCKALGMENLGTDPRFNSREKRLENKDEVMSILEEKFMQRTRAEWLEVLVKEGVPCGPVNNLAEALTDESVLYRDMIIEVERFGDKLKMLGNPVKLSKTKLGENIPPPGLGQNSIEILQDILGYTDEFVDRLLQTKIVTTTAAAAPEGR